MKNDITKELIEKVCPKAQTIEEVYNDDVAEIQSVCDLMACDKSEYFLTNDEYDLLIEYNKENN